MRVVFRRSLTAYLAGSVILAAAALGHAQTVRRAQAVGTEQVLPTVISGSDIGFRMEGRRGNTPVGRLVVRVNGRWVEVESAWTAKPITSK